MQYLNDDMDELFRSAAKDYPLNTDSADWEKVKKGLEEASAGGTKKPFYANNRRRYLWVLMLLPMAWICNRYGGEAGDGDTVRNAITKEPNAITKESLPQTVQKSKEPAAEPSLSGRLEAASESTPVSKKVMGQDAERDIYAPSVAGKSTPRKALPPAALEFNDVSHLLVIKTDTKQAISEEGRRKDGAHPIDLQEQQETIVAANSEESAPKAETRTGETIAGKTDSAFSAPSSTKHQKPRGQKRFYIGLLGGVDVTSVKMQEVKDIGYDIGFISGYQFNRKWSVEAGLLSAQKAYYSNGEYLAKAYVLPNTELKEAHGDCRMWEVPLLVRYHFKEGKKGGWFAAAGTASYFMNKEDYKYTYYYPATGQEVERSRSYEQKSTHIFAAAQVSGGYNRIIGNTIGVRVEPYLKLPLQKVGYYDLPLTSFGVHIGVTKKLF